MKSKSLKTPFLLLAGLALAGCAGDFDPATPITVVTREDGSGTKSAFMEIIGLKGKADVEENIVVASSTAAVLTEVENNPYAIAYDSLGYLDDTVKILTVDGVEATTENIQDGTYAISRPLNVIYQEARIEESPLLTDYLGFLSSSTAQQIIASNGYVSIVTEAEDYAVPASPLTGEIDISGSTSLQPLMTILAEEYEALNEGVTINVSGGGSGTGYENGQNGISDFGMISEEFNQSKADKCVHRTVAKDGIGIIVNKDNPLTDISKADLKTIYDVDADPGFQSWSELLEKAE